MRCLLTLLRGSQGALHYIDRRDNRHCSGDFWQDHNNLPLVGIKINQNQVFILVGITGVVVVICYHYIEYKVNSRVCTVAALTRLLDTVSVQYQCTICLVLVLFVITFVVERSHTARACKIR
jgi:hypothetical protein